MSSTEAPLPRDGGLVIAPLTPRSDPNEGHHGRVAYNVFNMRMTERQVAELRLIRDNTGITMQAHIRRAVYDYIHCIRQEHPEWLAKSPAKRRKTPAKT